MKVILHGSKQPYLNIGIYYGGIKLKEGEFHYFREYDAFIRKDLVKVLKKHLKEKGTFKSFIELVK